MEKKTAAKNTRQLIAPVAIDFGAKKTGVYYAKYPAGVYYSEIKTKGSIFGQELEYGKQNTALLNDRTANRHTRRRYDRLQFAKRLISLILKEYFYFPIEEHQQALGFLMNRRGFTRIEADFKRRYFKDFPQKAWDELPEAFKENLPYKSFAGSFDELVNDPQEEKTKKLVEILEKKNKKIRESLVYYKYVKKIKDSISKRQEGEQLAEKSIDKIKLSQISQWIVKRMIEEGVDFLKEALSNQPKINLLNYLNSLDENANCLKELNSLNFKDKEKSIKSSVWNFNPNSFDLEKAEKKGLFEDEDIKTHLHHFCHALYICYNEKKSGAVHRSRFFEEIKKLFDESQSCKHKYFQNFLSAVKNHSELDSDKIHKLICHISNLELKPLRAYFNDMSYKGGNKFDNERLSFIFSRWFLKHWRVTESKDGKNKCENYSSLKSDWKKHTNKKNVIDFWINKDPSLTIPPYQSMTNRQTPKCQTLLLNENYLNKQYSKWQEWLNLLQSDSNCDQKIKRYSEKLGNLKNKKEKALINNKEKMIRSFQFIMDSSKKSDAFRLNEIWSFYHKISQIEKSGNINKEAEQKDYKDKLKKSIEKSCLPVDLKEDLLFEKPAAFGHFINKYFQTRRKLRNSRYFLHHERKNKWDTENKLFALCAHKPRQKKYQMALDLYSIFRLSPSEINRIEKENSFNKAYKADNFKDLEKWLNIISRSIKTLSKKAADLQKTHKGELKRKVNFIERRGNTNALGTEDKKIYKLISECKKAAVKIAQNLHSDLSEEKQNKKAEKFNSLFSFAQIYNVVFKDRSGFSNTCPLCGIDNNLRMEEADEDSQKTTAASRLSALKIRLIDGAVKRICDSLSTAISNKLWDSVKEDLSAGAKIRIPLILEQNRFEFEPSLRRIKRQKKQQKDDNRQQVFDSKEQRIKEFSPICPYSGQSLGDQGEIDHIIPRAGQYGTLNDEANLIYASTSGNQKKGNEIYTLDRLNNQYKQQIFQANSYEEIKRFIYKELEKELDQVEEGDYFKFGKYFNFSNLSEKEKKAFRHALFLKERDP